MYIQQIGSVDINEKPKLTKDIEELDKYCIDDDHEILYTKDIFS